MKNLLKSLALVLTLGAVSVCGFAQQEVDPDHFDQPAAKVQKATPAHQVQHKNKKQPAPTTAASKAKRHKGHAMV